MEDDNSQLNIYYMPGPVLSTICELTHFLQPPCEQVNLIITIL